MTQYKQSNVELEAHLQEQIDFLNASANAFDDGFEGEAKRIAVAIRVLVHDTKSSRSLLRQLDRKDVPFLDSSLPLQEGNLSSHSGLTAILLNSDGASFVAMLDNGSAEPVWTDFDHWWNTDVFVDEGGRRLSRKELVLGMANQDGGAHVDPRLDVAYAALSRGNSLGWIVGSGPIPTEGRPLAGPERAAMRQVGHEVLKTLVVGYMKRPKPPVNPGIFMSNFTLRQID